jgi:hypothetical protein
MSHPKWSYELNEIEQYSSKMLGQQDECVNRFQELGVVEERAEVNSAEDACLVRRGLEWGT